MMVYENGGPGQLRFVDGSPAVENTAESLRQLLTELYVCAQLGGRGPAISDEEWERLHTTVLDAGEGRPFRPLDLPLPHR